MKHIWTFAFFLAGPVAFADVVETVTIENVFVPATGYDNNDKIQIMVDGQLPNQCYFLGATSWEVMESTKSILLRQEARRSTEGECADPAQLSEDMRRPKAFSSEIELRERLSEGDWAVNYQAAGQDSLAKKTFSVGVATVSNQVNEFHYPILESVSVYADGNNTGLGGGVLSCRDRIKIVLSGILPDSCVHPVEALNAPVVEEKGTLVVLARVRREGTNCLPVLSPYDKVVHADPLPVGRYMAHARSASGKGVNRLFTVIQPVGQTCPTAN